MKNAPNSTFFDIFSLDVEGAELAVAESIDFDRVGFGVVLVEAVQADENNAEKNRRVVQMFEENGYVYLHRHVRSDWFINRHFYAIYQSLLVDPGSEHKAIGNVNDLYGLPLLKEFLDKGGRL